MNFIKNSVLIVCLLAPFSLFSLTSFPMKVTVQANDTLNFVPFTNGWDTTAINISVAVSLPFHGKVRMVPSWFDSNAYFIGMDLNTQLGIKVPRSKTPKGYPGFRYIPDTGFTGRDSFTFRIKTSKDSTAVTMCAVRVTPPEPFEPSDPSNKMTVLLVVHGLLLPSIQTEAERLKNDLQNEGYASRIVSFTPSAQNNAEARRLWDTLRAEYDKPSVMLAGAILIGNIPYFSAYYGAIAQVSAYWCMSRWEADMVGDSTLIGAKVGVSGYNGVQFTPGYANIWISSMYGGNTYGTSLGAEVELIKRILRNNHGYRTGASRLPHTAFYYNMYSPNAEKAKVPAKYLDIWPKQVTHASDDTLHPFSSDFRQGGEIWELRTHGSADLFSAVLNSSQRGIWSYKLAALQQAAFPFRFLLADNCHTGGLGGMVNAHLLLRNSSCVLAMGPTDYVSNGYYLCDTSSGFPPHTWTRHYLAQGDRWGRAWLRGNGWIWSTIFHGDLSLKPNMGPANAIPRISGLTATRTGPLSWRYTVTASDSDDGIKGFEWWSTSYHVGKAAPDTSGLVTTFNKTYAVAAVCTVRVEAVDHYQARDWATVIIKTDSGVVMDAKGSPETKATAGEALSITPNPFIPSTRIRVRRTVFAAHSSPEIGIYNLEGQRISILTPQKAAGNEVEFDWNANGLPGGIYLIKAGLPGRTITKKAIFIK